MPRVRPIAANELAPASAEIYERFTRYGPFADQASVLAHVPPALDHLCAMLMELKQRQGVPWRYIELAIVVTSKLNACDYCVASHGPVLQVEGLSPAAIASLPGTDHPELTEVDKLVIEFATQVTVSFTRIRDDIFTRLKAHFSESQVVELTLRIALAGFYNRFNDTLRIDDGMAADRAGHAGTMEDRTP
jgi:AhpD family alkylhydroperoxidase